MGADLTARQHLHAARELAQAGQYTAARAHCRAAVDAAGADDIAEIDLGVRLNRQLTELLTTLVVIDQETR